MPRKERDRSGVGLCEPTGKEGWRLKFRDPHTDRIRYKVIPAEHRSSKEKRANYAADFAVELAEERARVARGGSRRTGTPIREAVEMYYSAHPGLRGSTLRAYQGGTDALLDFAKRKRLKTVDDLNARRLAELRVELVKKPKTVAAALGDRGEREKTGEVRSAYSVNRDLRGIKQCLRYLVAVKIVTTVSRDEIANRRSEGGVLELEKVTHRKKKPLRGAQITKLLEACERHDRAVFSMTRREKDRGRSKGTPKYKPVSPFVLTLLLGGFRLGEVFRLDWKDVDLDDEKIEIGSDSKTHAERDVDLSVSPSLLALLRALKLRSGGRGPVFDLSPGELRAALGRLVSEFGAPAFTAQTLRVTCAAHLASAPSIYKGSSLYMTAERTGHSPEVCDKHYARALPKLPKDAETLEAAMQIEKLADDIVQRAALPRKVRRAS